MVVNALYQLLTYLLVPCALVKLWWRGRADSAYRARWAERLALRLPHFTKPVIWLHAVSVGETIAVRPLVDALLARYGSTHEILITNGTVNGSRCTLKQWGTSVVHCYLPYDVGFLSSRFVKRVKPVLAMMMETEVWPNVLRALYRHNIPTLLINARLSERSQKAYARAASFFKPIFAGFSCIAAQAPTDGERFISLGAEPACVKIAGNLKFNVDVPAELKATAEKWRMSWQHKFIWLAASTHPGEEELILAAYARLKPHFPQLCLWIAPRHPERCDTVVKLASSFSSAVHLRSTINEAAVLAEDAIVVIDTLGELLLFYALADMALVGGSFGERGGHNILEPAAVGTAIMTGPGMYNFAAIFEQFKTAEALMVVEDSEAMVAGMTRVLTEVDFSRTLQEHATACFLAKQQALANHLAIIDNYL